MSKKKFMSFRVLFLTLSLLSVGGIFAAETEV